MTQKRWYNNGLRFECIECGDCCKTHGEYAFVYLSKFDVERISSYLNMTQIDFLNNYCATDEDGEIHLSSLVGDCSFLENSNRCKIYPVRPKQCDTWPFWIENLNKPTWEGPVSKCCPGIGRDKLYSKEEIESIANDRNEWYQKG